MTGPVLGLSTSSPLVSAALFSPDGRLLATAARHAPRNASSVLPVLLDGLLAACSVRLSEVAAYAVDVGPGSFTGVRVGVMFAKVLAYSTSSPVAAVSAFDLIGNGLTTFVPSRKGEVIVREPDRAPYRSSAPPEGSIGYASADDGKFPRAAQISDCWDTLTFVTAELIVPSYLAEPSISTPKRPFPGARTG